MTPRKTIAGALCIALLFAAVAPVTTATGNVNTVDDWAGSCDDAEMVESGNHSGALSPNDVDALLVNVSQGDYIELNFTYQGGAEQLVLSGNPTLIGDTESEEQFSQGTITARRGAEIEEVYPEGEEAYNYPDSNRVHLLKNNLTYQLRIYSEGSGPLCVGLETDGEAAANWKLAFAKKRANVPECNCTGL